jgi:hypothetical protein
VDGKRPFTYCSVERHSESGCGPKGKHFEHKDNLKPKKHKRTTVVVPNGFIEWCQENLDELAISCHITPDVSIEEIEEEMALAIGRAMHEKGYIKFHREPTWPDDLLVGRATVRSHEPT